VKDRLTAEEGGIVPTGRLDRVFEMDGRELATILLMVLGDVEEIPNGYRARIWSIGRRGPDIVRVAVAIETESVLEVIG